MPRLGESRAGPYLAQLDCLFRLDASACARVPLAEALFAGATADGLVPPPKSALGRAVGSLLAQRAPPTCCVTTPGARRPAHLFTPVENARQAGVDVDVDVEAHATALRTHRPDHSVRRLGAWRPRARQLRERARSLVLAT